MQTVRNKSVSKNDSAVRSSLDLSLILKYAIPPSKPVFTFRNHLPIIFYGLQIILRSTIV
jgi:hypothetical protein